MYCTIQEDGHMDMKTDEYATHKNLKMIVTKESKTMLKAATKEPITLTVLEEFITIASEGLQKNKERVKGLICSLVERALLRFVHESPVDLFWSKFINAFSTSPCLWMC